MAQSLVAPEVEAFVEDLSQSHWVEVNYLDAKGDLQRVFYDRNCPDEDIRIEMRPHLVATHSIQDADSPDGSGYRLETVEVPLERVLLSTVYENRGCPEPQCEYCGNDRPTARWVTNYGRLVRLP